MIQYSVVLYNTYIALYICVQALETDRKASLWRVFCPVSQRVQIVSFIDNVRILFLSCNVKKYKNY